jgi:site-specific DNA recombinase
MTSPRRLKIVARPLSALVARVSDVRAAKEGYSLDAQVPLLKGFADREGFDTEDRYILFDDGYQGDDWNRPAINKALALAASGEVQAVTFLNTDRFARDVVGGRQMVAKLMATGVAVIFGDLGRVRDDHNFMLMLTFKLGLGEYEKAMIRTRSAWGTMQKIEDGEVICAQAPYGYERWEDGLRILESEAAIVRLIFRLYDEGESIRGIVRRLKADDVTPPGATRSKGKKGNWNHTFVSDLLKDPTYIGKWHYGKTQSVVPKKRRSTKAVHRPKSSKRHLPPSEWKKVEVPAIIGPAIFERVQAKAQANIHTLGGRPSYRYELKGLVFCARCGRPYLGSAHRGVRYYCSNICRDKGTPLCPALSVRADLIEPVIYGAVEELLTQQEVLEEAIGKLRKASTSQGKRDSLIARSEELRRLEFKARREKLHAKEDAETEAFYAQEIKEIVAQRSQIQRQIDAMMPAIASIDADAIMRAARKAFATKDRAKRQEILRHFVRRIVYDDRDHTVEIQVAIPMKSAAGTNEYCKSQLAEIDSILLIPIKRRVA